MEPEGSLPHSQAPAICPYPKPNQSMLSLSLFLKIHLNIILPSTPGSSKWVSFPQDSPPNPCIYLSCSAYVLHAQRISSRTSSLGIYIIISHWILLHVSARKVPSSGNNNKVMPHKTKLVTFYTVNAVWESQTVKMYTFICRSVV